MNDPRLTHLVQAHLDGLLTPHEQRELDHLIRSSESARRQFWEEAAIHGATHEATTTSPDLIGTDESLAAGAGENLATPVTPGESSIWRRLSAAAAGLVLGVLSASFVWAYAVPLVSQAQRVSREIVFESFEDPDLRPPGRFPTHANQWFGKVLSVPGDARIPGVKGTRVGQFETKPDRRFTYARYIVDLDEHPEPSDEHTRTIEVGGSFFSPDLAPTSLFRIHVVALREAPDAVQPVWNDREHFDDNVLQQVERTLSPDPDDQPAWHDVRVSMEIPNGARSVLVSLGSGKRAPGGAGTDRYLDAVRVRLVDSLEPQR